MQRLTVLLLWAGLMSACSSFHHNKPKKLIQAAEYPCKAKANTLYLDGYINKKMLGCVQTLVQNRSTPIKTISVDSPGGEVDTAIDIADMIAPYKADLLVRKECNSSCADYFIPVSKSVRLEKGAYILIHGTIDSGSIEESRKKYPGAYEKNRQLVKKNLDFLLRHHIHKGWWLWRDPEDSKEYGTSYGKFITGKPYFRNSFPYIHIGSKNGAVMVEEKFIKSCLGETVYIYPFKGTLVQNLYQDKKLMKKAMKQWVQPSGTMRCKKP